MKTTLHSVSQMLPITISVCLNDGITCLAHGKSAGRWGNTNVSVTIDVCSWPVAITTCTLGAEALNFWSGASLEK